MSIACVSKMTIDDGTGRSKSGRIASLRGCTEEYLHEVMYAYERRVLSLIVCIALGTPGLGKVGSFVALRAQGQCRQWRPLLCLMLVGGALNFSFYSGSTRSGQHQNIDLEWVTADLYGRQKGVAGGDRFHDGQAQYKPLTEKMVLRETSTEPPPQHGKKRRKNVLFVMTDDLRPELSVYGRPAITPNFDRLAGMSTVFERAYNQDPICNPSRASLLTGRRPDTTQVWLFEADPPPTYQTLFRFLRDEGNYAMYGSGKLMHWVNSGKDAFHKYWPQDTVEWNKLSDENYKLMNSTAQPDDNWPIDRYLDSKVAAHGIEMLEKAAADAQRGDQPFFLGVGFHQPHRPWHMPKKFWDLYEDVYVPVAPHRNRPVNSPDLFVGDINPGTISMLEDPEERYHVNLDQHDSMPDRALREQMRGYLSSISFIDYQIGRLLDALERLNLMDDTVIAFCVDHGLNVGDHGLWDKRTLLETTSRVPLIIRDPSTPSSFNTRVASIVENVDIFPTIAQLLGLPHTHMQPPLEGASLVPLMRGAHSGGPEWPKDFAVTQIARCCATCARDRKGNPRTAPQVSYHQWEVCRGASSSWYESYDYVVMGYSLRTDDWRYNVWMPFNTTTKLVDWSGPIEAEELYDHRDPRCNEARSFDLCEDVNLAGEPSLANVRTTLRDRLATYVQTHHRAYWAELAAQ